MKRLFLIAEYCPGPFYMGWHLYLRDSTGRQQRNADGEWGWLRDGPSSGPSRAQGVFDALGIAGSLVGGGCDDGAIGRFAFAHPIGRQRIGGKPRGCVPVIQDEWGRLALAALGTRKGGKQ